PFIVVVAGLLTLAIGWRTGAAYVGGALCSILAGFFGMSAATHANVRTAEAARARGQAAALRVAFSGGAVMGLAVASLGLLGSGMGLRTWRGGAAVAAGGRDVPPGVQPQRGPDEPEARPDGNTTLIYSLPAVI